jgi:hypothetical protein
MSAWITTRGLRRRVLMLMLGVAMPGVAAGEPGPSPRAVYSLDQIRKGISESRDRLRSIEVEFEAPERDPSDGTQAPGILRRVVAARDASRYVYSVHFNADQPSGLDLETNEIYYDGTSKVLQDFRPAQRYCETFQRNADNFSWKVRCEFFLECTGWWPPGDRSQLPARESPFFLFEALADERCRVLPLQEKVGEAWCHVVERPGVDRLWLDPEIGFAPRRRQWYHGHPTIRNIEYTLSDYREAAPKVWIPWRLRRLVVNPTRRASEKPVGIEGEIEAVVVRAEVNQVPESRFRLAILPGTLIWDGDTGTLRQVPGGLAFLDVVAELAERRAAIYARNRSASAGGRGASWRQAVLSVVLPVGLLIAVFAILHARFGKRRGSLGFWRRPLKPAASAGDDPRDESAGVIEGLERARIVGPADRCVRERR